MLTVASRSGHISVVDLASRTLRHHRPTLQLAAVCPHPTKPQIAWVDENSGFLVVQTSGGNPIAELRPPAPRSADSHGVKQGFQGCFFDEGGKVLWVVAPLSTDQVELQVVETDGWSVTHRATFEDEFGASSWSFHHTGRPGLVTLWSAAGQDGWQPYWLRHDDGRLAAEKVNELVNCTPPVFSPDASEFLTVTDNGAICRYEFGTLKQRGTPLDSGIEGDPFFGTFCYLDGHHALAGTNWGRVFLLDLERMEVEEEATIAGHETRPIGEYHPELATERGLGTDISWLARFGDVVVFVCSRERGMPLDRWKDSLLLLSLRK